MVSLIVRDVLNQHFKEVIEGFQKEIYLNISKSLVFSKEVIQLGQPGSEYCVIDYQLILDPEDFIESIRQLRIRAPRLKIIILLSSSQENQGLLQSIIHLGIYNIIVEADHQLIINELISILKNNRQYHHVVQYDLVESTINPIVNEEDINKNPLSKYVSIGIVGSEIKVGVTHSAIMMAMYLKRFGKVAYLEMNDSKALSALKNTILSDHSKLSKIKVFKYQGIDYYHKMPMASFINNHSVKYDYIIFDFGAFEKIRNIESLLICDMKCVIASGIDWRMKQTMKAYRYLNQFDQENTWYYLVPFIHKKYLKEIHKKIQNKVMSLPFNMNPFYLEHDTKKIMDKIYQIKDKQSLVSRLTGGLYGI